MEEEENKNQINPIDEKMKKEVENQLDSFINPEEQKPDSTLNTFYSNPKTEGEPLIKIKDLPEIEEKKEERTRPIIRTYKSDVEGSIQTNHLSSINIALAENRRRFGSAQETKLEEKHNTINKTIIIMSILLVLGGVATIIIPQILIQLQYGTKNIPTETFPSRPIMTVDVEEKLNLKDINIERLGTTLKERVDQSSTRLGQIKNIFLTEGEVEMETLISAQKFLELIKVNMPSEIERTLKENYMFGLHNYNGNQRFLILKVGSYDTTFSGMLYWEQNLWQDFKELFDLKSENGAENEFAIEIKKFQDATFENRDCRIVKNPYGDIVFLYCLIDENTIVLTTSTDTLKEIINRISKARVITQ
jgi:hypothetical protein